MAITINLPTGGPVVLKECWEDFKKGIDLSRGPYVEATYTTDRWDLIDGILETIMGGVTPPVAIGGATVRSPALRCPQAPGLSATDAWCDGVGEYDALVGGRAAYNIGKIHVSYGVRTWEQQPAEDPAGLNSFPNDDQPGQPFTFAVQSIDYASETIKLPTSAYKFQTAPILPVDIPLVKHIGCATLVFELKRVPFLPWLTIKDKMNKLNNATFLGCDQGTLLFLGARTTRQWESNRTIVQDITYTFKWREYHWNKHHRPDENSFDTIVDPYGNKPYVESDLRPLLTVANATLQQNILDA